jgi:hypothetical protein
MIQIWDPCHVLQELQQVQPGWCPAESESQAQIHVLPTQCDQAYQISDIFTIFVDTEPAMHSALEAYKQQRQARPFHIWAVSAHSPSVPWCTPTLDLWINMIYVARLNAGMPPVTLGHKSWLATALWGGWSRYRAIMLEELCRQNLDHRCLITHLQRRTSGDRSNPYIGSLYRNYETPGLADLDLAEFRDQQTEKGFFSMQPLGIYHGQGWISQLIPWRIYDAAMVSIVAETVNLGAPDTFYISEKISRPIMLAQPFWVHGCRGYLQQLRDLGFRTYDRWWDESYDLMHNQDERARAVIASFAEFARRSDRDQQRIVAESRSCSLHNREHMLDMQWHYRDLVQYLNCNFAHA